MTTTAFEPSRYLSRIGGAEYLEVKWRLVWLRDRHPDACIETDLMHYVAEDSAVFKARIIIPRGPGEPPLGSATGWGSENIRDFRDFIEKAETKAIGRALAALGFGTQFCPDHEFGAAAGKVVDAPVSGRSRPRVDPVEAASQTVNGSAAAGGGPDTVATQRQLRYLIACAREAGHDEAALNNRAETEFGVSAPLLSRRDASTLIEKYTQERKANEG